MCSFQKVSYVRTEKMMKNIIVAQKYEVKGKLGGGSFGIIYKGESIEDKTQVAIKLEPSQSKSPQLEGESKIYKLLEGGVGIPNIYFYGKERGYNIMVIDLLGLSLEDLLAAHEGPFSLKTVLMLADQMISCVEFLHRKKIIHRDIKPDNFMIGTHKNKNQVHIIDFGLSKYYINPTTNTHVPFSENRSLTGTARYASINAMCRKEQSRRDDMESLGYIFMYLLRGNLPWQGLPAKTQHEKIRRIIEVKMMTSVESLCDGFPNEFADYLRSVKGLGFFEEPPYATYRKMFHDLMIRENIPYDYVYDWSDKISVFTDEKPPLSLPPCHSSNTQPNSPRVSENISQAVQVGSNMQLKLTESRAKPQNTGRSRSNSAINRDQPLPVAPNKNRNVMICNIPKPPGNVLKKKLPPIAKPNLGLHGLSKSQLVFRSSSGRA
ncbi:CK1 family protein kinase [Histomonas meleagridis]|uniref:CK1 family protein kinase n=1 Tax=Histomonas meleagridis TaxID=135588 RepID=UPI00355A4BB0|nr:CK1 family protein kinase [Histomonas meleagridis]KAH0796372.1 CK1 family protein kinase [Histomonas meleagridis]